MKYKILYNYDTGDSFSSECGLEGYIEISWENETIAQENLKRIQEHYIQYEELNYSRKSKTNQDILIENQEKDWFVKIDRLVCFHKLKPDRMWAINEVNEISKMKDSEQYDSKHIIDESMAENCVILYTDDGKPFQFWCPWCGYFEQLNSVEIVSNQPKNKITFN